MPRAKRKSDELYNERRRAKRLAARIERQQFQTKRERIAAESYVANLRKQIEQTYISRGVEFKTAEKAARSLGVQTRRDLATAEQRANEIFAREVRVASTGAASSLGERGQQYVKIFYAATQSIWEGQPLENRNKSIMAALGTGSLQEAFMEVLSKNRKAIRAARHQGEPIGVTDENAFFYNDMEYDESFGSPEYLDFVTEVMR